MVIGKEDEFLVKLINFGFVYPKMFFLIQIEKSKILFGTLKKELIIFRFKYS